MPSDGVMSADSLELRPIAPVREHAPPHRFGPLDAADATSNGDHQAGSRDNGCEQSVHNSLRNVQGVQRRDDTERDDREPDGAAGLFTFWLVALTSLLVATSLVRPESLESLPRQLLDYTPRLLAAGLILLGGYAIAGPQHAWCRSRSSRRQVEP